MHRGVVLSKLVPAHLKDAGYRKEENKETAGI